MPKSPYEGEFILNWGGAETPLLAFSSEGSEVEAESPTAGSRLWIQLPARTEYDPGPRSARIPLFNIEIAKWIGSL